MGSEMARQTNALLTGKQVTYVNELAHMQSPHTEHFQEQFSEDWDYCDENPLHENITTHGEVAARFGPASNIYHAGMVSQTFDSKDDWSYKCNRHTQENSLEGTEEAQPSQTGK